MTATTAPTQVARSLTMGQKLAFGVGGLANQLFTAAQGVFMVVLILGLGMDPVLAGLLGAIPRIWDALTDPVMGYVSDNISTKYGRRRPFILLGSIITGLSFIFMWQVYSENSQMYNFYYFLIWSLAFYLGYTIFATPYVALGYEMSDDYHERTSLMAFSQWIGQLAWVIAPWFWVVIYMPDLFATPAQGARTLSIYVGLFCLVLGIVPALYCREPQLAPTQKLTMTGLKQNVVNFFKGIWQTFNCLPFIRLCGATFLVFNGFQTVAQFSFFIIVYYLFNGNFEAAGRWPAWFGTLSALSTCLVVIPFITWISKSLGKKNTFIFSSSLSILGYILMWWCYNPSNPWLMFIPLPLVSFGIGGLFTLMMSMTADVCDLDELQNGLRREGTFGAVYWWMVKLGTALALITSGFALKWAGFNQDIGAQSDDTLTKLRIAYIAVPVVTTLLSIIIMWSYNITEKRADEIREELKKRHLAKAQG